MLKKFKWLAPGAVPLMCTVLLTLCWKMFWSENRTNWFYLLIFGLLFGWNVLSLLWQIRSEKTIFRRFIHLMLFLLASVGLSVVFYVMEMKNSG